MTKWIPPHLLCGNLLDKINNDNPTLTVQSPYNYHMAPVTPNVDCGIPNKLTRERRRVLCR